MSGEDIKAIERPWHVICILEGIEGFHSGHEIKESAEACAAEANKRAIAMGIKSRYSVKEKIPTQEDIA